MLTIICGEDTRASRKHFQSIKEQYVANGFEIVNLSGVQYEMLREQMTESASLFQPKRAFFSEGLVKSLKLKRSKEMLSKIDTLVHDKHITWFDWETYSAREITNPKTAKIQEFKVAASIFNLLDECYPGNMKHFITQMNVLLDTEEDGFIYAMLCKHIRGLILAKTNSLPGNTSPWARKKMTTQAALWPYEKLVSFYEGLARLDVSIKTSNNPHGIKKSIDILACYLL